MIDGAQRRSGPRSRGEGATSRTPGPAEPADRPGRPAHPTAPRWLRPPGLVPWLALALLITGAPAPALAQDTTDRPLPNPIETEEGLVVVDVVDFARIPDHPNGPARMMVLFDEPATERLFVNDMWGPIWWVSYDGSRVAQYVDIDDPRWGVGVNASGRERGFQSFAFHPEFGVSGAPGEGRFYTWTDVRDNESPADFRPGGGNNTHHTVLHEWRAEDPLAETYDGGPPRELIRKEQPFGNHNAGLITFHPRAEPGDPEYGLLYIGSADGGSGGDPLNLAQDLGQVFGKILRIDPLGSDSRNGRYGIPADNPFVDDPGALDEIYAYGMRNPQRFGWDPANGNMFVAEIGQNIVEWVSRVTPGGNMGWNDWEGSFGFISRSEVSLEAPRSDPGVNYPVVEYSRHDPLMADRVAATGIHVFREGRFPGLEGRVLFGDFVAGEILHFDADHLPEGGTEGIRRVLLRHQGQVSTFLELIRARNVEQGREPSGRTDLRFGTGPDHRFFLLNKHDGWVREVVPGR